MLISGKKPLKSSSPGPIANVPSSILACIFGDRGFNLYKLCINDIRVDNDRQRTTCNRQGVWPPLKPKIKSYFSTFSLDCSIR